MAKSEIFQAPVGTKDVIGEESRSWYELIALFSKLAHLYNYDLSITPMFENFEVFARLGEDSDIVSKEMYDFMDKGNRHIALRPEGTAGLVRAVAQHRPTMPFKAWYFSSVFRYERPQKGRLREHHQLGIEALGIDDPLIDVEIMQFANDFIKKCGLKNVTLKINSLGDSKAREEHHKALVKYFQDYKSDFGEEFTARVEKNPFRMLDTKVPEWLEVAAKAPKILDYISDESREDFEIVCKGLDELSIGYEVTSHLVRGLDYYTNTAFEFVSNSLDAAQSTICGGGRYNKLVAQMGGPETSGIGFGLGVERFLLAIEAENIQLETRVLDCVVVDLVNNEESRSKILKIKDEIRKNKLSLDSVFGNKSLKSAMKQIDRLNAKFALIVGEEELAKNVISLKDMHSGEQHELEISDAIERLKK